MHLLGSLLGGVSVTEVDISHQLFWYICFSTLSDDDLERLDLSEGFEELLEISLPVFVVLLVIYLGLVVDERFNVQVFESLLALNL